MFSFTSPRPTGGVSRRELIRIGGLGAMGLTLPNLLAANENGPGDATFGRAKNVIFLYLAGGPPQHETFDPKPEAPAEIRGPFKPVCTNVPGIHFCELLPRTARIADKLAVVRSMSTDDNTHSSSGYWVLTGSKYTGPNPRTIQPTDWPYFGSIVKRYRPSEVLPPLSAVWIPDVMRLNENVTPAGQTGGFMGDRWTPDRFVGDPSLADYQVEGLRLSDLSPEDMSRRHTLLAELEQPFNDAQRGRKMPEFDKLRRQAHDLLTSGKARRAFDVNREPEKTRIRYGQGAWGQSVLLARRLIEAGVRLVHVQWPREPGDNAVDNPLWDTHAQNADRLEDVLCPQFDVGFSALIEDLDERGLLDETLVVAIGEFGRTPKINAKGGRDHWGPVFSFVMAGAGIGGGQVYGKSDRQGGHPAEDRVRPGDLTATMFHLLGLDYRSSFTDATGRPHRLTEGRPLFTLLGTIPATDARCESNGDLARVPPYDPTLTLVHTSFSKPDSVQPINAPSRPKGWRADPLNADGPFSMGVIQGQAAIGLFGGERKEGAVVQHGATAILAQEVRSPFAGSYTLRIRVRGEAATEAAFDEYFLKHFTCRLAFFQFTDAAKQAMHRKDLATVEFRPAYSADALESIELSKTFVNPKPGSNFSFGLGLGVAITVEKTSPGELQLPPGESPLARIRVADARLEFNGKARIDDVKV